MAQLPLYKNDNPEFQWMQAKWKSALDPILANPVINGLQLPDITLIAGTNVINHRLNRKMQGWMVTDTNSPYMPYRSAAFNDSTLTLTSSVSCTVSLWVF